MTRLPVLLCAALVLGCGEGTAPTDSLVTTVSLTPATVSPTETLSILVTVRNTGAFPVTLHGSSSCLLRFRVEILGGMPVNASVACATVMQDVTIPAGDQVSTTIPWDLQTTTGPLAPGSYLIRGGIQLAGGRELQAIGQPAVLTVSPLSADRRGDIR